MQATWSISRNDGESSGEVLNQHWNVMTHFRTMRRECNFRCQNKMELHWHCPSLFCPPMETKHLRSLAPRLESRNRLWSVSIPLGYQYQSLNCDKTYLLLVKLLVLWQVLSEGQQHPLRQLSMAWWATCRLRPVSHNRLPIMPKLIIRLPRHPHLQNLVMSSLLLPLRLRRPEVRLWRSSSHKPRKTIGCRHHRLRLQHHHQMSRRVLRPRPALLPRRTRCQYRSQA